MTGSNRNLEDPNQILADALLEESKGVSAVSAILDASFSPNADELRADVDKNKLKAFMVAETVKAVRENKVKVGGKRFQADHIDVMGGGNNVIVDVNAGKDGGEVILQIGFIRPTAAEAVRQLTGDAPPLYFPKNYGEIVYTGFNDQITIANGDIEVTEQVTQADGSKMAAQKPSVNQFAYNAYGFASVIEKCVTLEERMRQERMQQNLGQGGLTPVQLTQKVGTQISAMLSDLSNHNILWGDLKPGNIMLRDSANIQIVTPDRKAFIPVDQLLLRQKGTGVGYRIHYDDFTTENYLSPHFRSNTFGVWSTGETPAAVRAEAKSDMEKEYSYQLAIVLYYTVTGKDVVADNSAFNFQVAAFDSPEGKRLQSIIERLSHADPDQRMHHTDAAKLLRVLDNRNEFNKVDVKVKAASATPEARAAAATERETAARALAAATAAAKEKMAMAQEKMAMAKENTDRNKLSRSTSPSLVTKMKHVLPPKQAKKINSAPAAVQTEDPPSPRAAREEQQRKWQKASAKRNAFDPVNTNLGGNAPERKEEDTNTMKPIIMGRPKK